MKFLVRRGTKQRQRSELRGSAPTSSMPRGPSREHGSAAATHKLLDLPPSHVMVLRLAPRGVVAPPLAVLAYGLSALAVIINGTRPARS